MFIRPIFLLFVALLLVAPVAYSAPLEDWDALIVEGSKKKYDGNYSEAAASFSKAVTFAEKQKLPNKCLPISLCRLAEAQLNANQVKEADSHFDQITNLFKTQKASGKLDSQVSFWVAALSDAYLSNHKPETRELCIKHACYLKTLAYGASHRNCTDCLNKLAEYYIDADKVDKALKILEMNEGLTAKQFGKNPDRFGNLLNDLAIKCEKEHKYNQAKQLEQEVIKIAQTNKSELNAGLPAFDCFLSMNALAQNRPVESKQYFNKAEQECHKIVKEKKKKIERYLGLLFDVCMSDDKDHKTVLATAEMRELITVHEVIKTDPNMQYAVYTSLAGLLCTDPHMDWREHTRLLQHAIDIVSLPNNPCHRDLTGLYLRMAMGLHGHNHEKGDELFAKTLKLANGPNWDSVNILYCWGIRYRDDHCYDMAAKKFNAAYREVCLLPPEKRGTWLADIIQLLAIHERECGHNKKADLALKRSEAEIQLQKKLNTKLGPDIYHRLSSNKK